MRLPSVGSFKTAIYIAAVLFLSHAISSAESLTALRRSRVHIRGSMQYPDEIIQYSAEEVQQNITQISSEFIPIPYMNNNQPLTLAVNNETAWSVSVWDCGSPEATPISYTIDSCTGDPCVVHSGRDITFQLSFRAKESATRLSCDILAKKGLIKAHFPCPESDMCYAPGLACPLEVGQIYSFSVTQNISPQIPRWTWYIQGTMWDQNGRQFLCVAAHAKVVRLHYF